VAVAGLVVLSTLLRLWIGLGVTNPWILPDEILYSDLAKSIAEGNLPAVRESTALGWGVVYPTLIAPAWALFGDPVSAYHAALAINALLMSSAAVPAYLLARCFVSSRLALAVAALTVLVPSMAYTGVVMTENAFYPLFLWTVLAITRVVRRPTAGAQLLTLAAVAALAATRIQGVALIAALVGSVALYAACLPRGEWATYLRRFLPTIGLGAAFVVAAVSVVAVRGGGLLGEREGTFDGLRLVEVPQWFAYLLGGLVLYVALIPAAATGITVLLGLRRAASEGERLFASVVVPVAVAVLLTVALVSASIDVDGTENLNERYVFYLVPLLVLGLAVWMQSGYPRPRRTALLVVVGCGALAASVPVDRLEYNAGFQSPALLPWIQLSDVRIVLLVALCLFIAGAGALWLRCRPEHCARLWLVVAAWLALVGTMTVSDNSARAAVHARAFSGRAATWVDDAVPGGEKVAVVWRQRDQARAATTVEYWLMVTEMFNAAIGPVYRIGPATYYEDILPSVRVGGRAGTVIRLADGAPLRARYVLATCRTPVEGRVVASSPFGALQLIEARTPVRLARRANCPGSD
jgi:hypothetical protein